MIKPAPRQPSPRDEAINTHSDLFKEIHGFRPRRDWSGVALEEIEEEIKALLFDEEEVQ